MSAATALQTAPGAAVTASPVSPTAATITASSNTSAAPAAASSKAAASSASSVTPPAERWAVGVQVIARYPFEGTSPEDLPFQRKDVLTIVRQTKDPMWYRARNADGLEGMIPANYVRLKDDNAAAAAGAVASSATGNSLPRGASKLNENGGVSVPTFKASPVNAGVNGAASPMSSSNPSVTDSLNSTSSDGAAAAVAASGSLVDAASSAPSSNSNLPLIKSQQQQQQQQQSSLVSPTSNNPLPNNVIASSVSKTNVDNNNSTAGVGSTNRTANAMVRSSSDNNGE